MDELKNSGGEKLDRSSDVINEKLNNLVSDFAKPCVAKALDYTLLVLLLVLQFMKCSPPSTDDIRGQFVNDDNTLKNVTVSSSTINSIYSCNLSEAQSSIFLASDAWINGLVLTAIIIAFLYGIVCGVGVWIHASRKSKDREVPRMVEKLYSFTARILIIDTALEIPIAFYWTPITTVILWIFFTISIVGLFLLSALYAKTVPNDPNAQSVFNTSSFLVGFSLFKLTGEVSQYWVMYIASMSNQKDIEETAGKANDIMTKMMNFGNTAKNNGVEKTKDNNRMV